MTKLWELEQRLRDEPDNLGLRVALAGELREVGRLDDAVELYRSVAIAYRAQGRTQQAIAVCQSVLDLAPDDASCQALLAAMSSWHDITPLPLPLPHHIAEPTIPPMIPPMPQVAAGRPIELSPADLPPSLRAELEALDDDIRPRLAGIASAARKISASLLAATESERDSEPETDRVETVDTADVLEVVTAVEDEQTTPREQPNRPPTDTGAGEAADPLASPLLAAIAGPERAGVLDRFRRRAAAIGTTVIRRGETGHGLVLVVRGRLDVHSERADGARVSLEAIEPGGFVGELSLLARAPAPAYVVAARDSELLVLAAADFDDVSRAFPRWRSELRASADRRQRAYADRLR